MIPAKADGLQWEMTDYYKFNYGVATFAAAVPDAVSFLEHMNTASGSWNAAIDPGPSARMIESPSPRGWTAAHI